MTRSGLDPLTRRLLLAALILSVLHHADHVLRVDHSGWPFRAAVTPFTASLLAYPMILFALFGGRRLYWLRWLLLVAGTGFTIYAHSAIEGPRDQFAMWAQNAGRDRDGSALHNLPDIRSPLAGAVAVVIGMALNLTAVAAVLSMLANGLRRGDPPQA